MTNIIDPPNAPPAEFLRQMTELTRLYGFKVAGPFDLERTGPDDEERSYRNNGSGRWEYG